MSRSAVVVGAGLGGIATAIRLAYKGWRVTVLEQGERPGGKMNRLERGGFSFDTGPSLITLPAVFRRLFALGGVDFDRRLNPMRVDPLFDYRFADGEQLTYSSQLPDLTGEIERLTGSGDDVEGLYRFLNLGARLFDLSEQTFFKRPPFARPQVSDLPLLFSAPKRHAWGGYQKAVRKHFKDPRLRQLYERYPTYVGASPRDAVGTLALIPYMEIAEGGWYVPGGLYRIVEELCGVARTAGVDIHTGVTVKGFVHDGGRISGVETADGEKLEADVVVSNVDPATVYSMTDGEAGISLRPDQLSMSGFVMLIGLGKKLDGTLHHTVCFSSDYDREFEQIFKQRQFPDDPTVYINVPSRTDPSVAPDGCESVFVMANTPPEPGSWTQDYEVAAVQKVRSRLEKSGMPDLFDDARFIDCWTPARLESQYGAPGGSIYGRVSHGWKGSFMRPPQKDKKLNGLFYVGGGTHPGGGDANGVDVS